MFSPLLPRDPPATPEKALAILELVAERGGVTAREVSDALGYPLPTVYRLLQTLVGGDYVAHQRAGQRFEPGYRLDRLGVSLHRMIGVPDPVRAEVAHLHGVAGAAAYFALYRGADVMVVHVVDSPVHPRLLPLGTGLHEAAHATAFGKIMLAAMTDEQVSAYLDVHGMQRVTATTLTTRPQLEETLRTVAHLGVAWERDEFVPGETCAAVGVRNALGLVIGAVAVSAPSRAVPASRERTIERELRAASNRISSYYRSGQV